MYIVSAIKHMQARKNPKEILIILDKKFYRSKLKFNEPNKICGRSRVK